ncbi:hypothetical protein M9458_036845, partial [Cirrhinus mrigala]
EMSGEDPRESLVAYVEWVLVSCNSTLTVDFVDDDTSPTLDPEPSQPSPRFVEREPEPTADGEPEPSVTEEPSPKGATELRIALEPEPVTSDQVREPATMYARKEVTVERKGAKEGPAHCISAEGELRLDLGLFDLERDSIDLYGDVYEDMPPLLPPSSELSASHEISACLDVPHTLPLLSPSIVPAASVPTPLSPDSPAAYPQPTICAVGLPRVC